MCVRGSITDACKRVEEEWMRGGREAEHRDEERGVRGGRVRERERERERERKRERERASERESVCYEEG